MLHLHCLSLCNKQSLSLVSLPQIPFTTNNKPIPLVSLWLSVGDGHVFKKSNTNHPCNSLSYGGTVHAVKKDSQQYEINPDEAKEALQKLDRQLQALSEKKVAPAKIKGSLSLVSAHRHFQVHYAESIQQHACIQFFLLFLLSSMLNIIIFVTLKVNFCIFACTRKLCFATQYICAYCSL